MRTVKFQTIAIFVLFVLLIILNSCVPSQDDIQSTARAIAREYIRGTETQKARLQQITPSPNYEATSFWADAQERLAEDAHLETSIAEYEAQKVSQFATDAAESRYSPEDDCINWRDASSEIGEETCVEGVVQHIYNSETAAFINFDSTNLSFYGVTFDYRLDPAIVGSCIRINGTITTYEGRPQIIISDPDQVWNCE